MIYIATITYSVLEEDGRKRLKHDMQVFPSETMAVQYVDRCLLAWTGEEKKYRIGTVFATEAEE